MKGARRYFVPNQARMMVFKDGEAFLPGLQAMSAPGHTIGHTAFMVTSGNDALAVIRDLTHHHVILLETPLTEFAFDSDPSQSAQARVRRLDMLAAQRLPMIAYPVPWPGIGHVERAGEGFRHHPAPMILQDLPA